MPEEFEIREYDEGKDLAALAVHWEESVRGWPPGFETSGDFSPEAVRQWLMRTRHIACWLGWLGDRIVSFLKYAELSEDSEATYVDLFNTHPDYHGMGYGRRIMTVCIDKAIEDNVKRVDLHTWSANTKAVPLYKKTGFFWRPRTSYVHMYNFLPAVVNNPLVRSFLGDTWWYESLRQPLEIKEDDETYNGCFYHKYIFERDGKRMEVLVDPSTSGVVGIDSDELAVRCDVPGRTHVAGLPQPVVWHFRSSRREPVRIRLKCVGQKGLDYELDEEFELSGEREIETSVIPSSDMRPEKIDWYGKPIECSVSVDDVEFSMKPGIRTVRPFAMRSAPYPIRLIPGEERTFILNLTSHIAREAEFVPVVKADGIEVLDTVSEKPVAIPSEGGFGIPLRLKAPDEPGSATIELGGHLTVGDSESGIHPIVAGVAIAPLGKPVGLADDDPDILSISNGIVSVVAKKKGGKTEFIDFESGAYLCGLYMDSIGEPFADDLRGKDYDIEVVESDLVAEMVFRVESDAWPGIEVERRISLGTGTEIRVGVGLTNRGKEPFEGMYRFKLGDWRVIRMFVPLRGRVVTGARESWLEGLLPLPTDPAEYPEPWVAWLHFGPRGKEPIITGILFEGADRFEWESWAPLRIEWAVRNLAPGESVEIGRIRLLLDVSHWRNVQAAALRGEPSTLPLSVFEYAHAESPLFADDRKASVTFNLMKSASVKGSAEITMPDGGTVDSESEKWNLDAPIEIECPEVDQNVTGLIPVGYKMKVVSVEREGKLPIIYPRPDSRVRITKGVEGEYEYFDVDNGAIRFSVAPKYSGTCFRLAESSAPDKNLLRSPFPEQSMWVWWNPWFGGISTYLQVETFLFHQCEFEGDPIRLRWAGNHWEGVRVTAGLIRGWQGLRFESYFLTRPGYPVILNLVRMTETEGNSRILGFENLFFPCPSGDPSTPTEGMMVTADSRVRVARSEHGSGEGSGRWVAVYDPESRKTVGAVSNCGEMYLWDAGNDGQVVFWTSRFKTRPERTMETACMHVVCDDPEMVPVLARTFAGWGSIVAESQPEVRGIDG